MHEPNITILAGGMSSRMKKFADRARSADPVLLDEATRQSKSMIGVGSGQRPFLDYLLYTVQAAGYRHVVLLTGEHDTSIRHYYEEGRGRDAFPDLTMSFAIQRIPAGRTKPLGTADAVLCALDATPRWRGQQFAVCNSDNLYSQDALRTLLESDAPNSMIAYAQASLGLSSERIGQCALLKRDASGYLQDIVEKPTAEELASMGEDRGGASVSMNLFRFTYDAIVPFLREVPLHPQRQEKELPQAVRMMIARPPLAMRTYPLAEYVPDLTTVDDIAAVQRYVKAHASTIRF